ncbi:MAG: tRNA (guanosine(37)-N1)-methyltransferase TrmD [Terrimicrobiaceae bacterium]|nr:tRNA (guanosine(37)-N1)-methyltransferase TrmD [Terrimicrobiaceae bacterium]
MIKFDIITIFPEIFSFYFGESILKRAQQKKLIKIQVHNLRDYSDRKNHHRQVDDRPYGGGPGMILMVEPMAKAIQRIKNKELRIKKKTKVIMLTPAGKQFDQKMAQRLSKYSQLVLLCGRYEGFDARLDKYVDEKISIGPYVLSGGEIPAMVITEAVARNIPGVLGHQDATKEETFSGDLDYIEYPQYTRPENYKGQKVPKILLSGNHAEIKKWQQSQSKKRK